MKKVWLGVTILGLLLGIIMAGCQTAPTSPYLRDNISQHATIWNPETDRYEPVPEAAPAEEAAEVQAPEAEAVE